MYGGTLFRLSISRTEFRYTRREASRFAVFLTAMAVAAFAGEINGPRGAQGQGLLFNFRPRVAVPTLGVA